MGNIIDLNDFVKKLRCSEEYVVLSPYIDSDIDSLLDRSGLYNQFVKKLAKSIRILEGLGKRCVECSNLFELLKGTERLYSIKIKGQKNIRILFHFLEIEKKEKAILLICFEENETKDYHDSIVVAYERLNEIMERL